MAVLLCLVLVMPSFSFAVVDLDHPLDLDRVRRTLPGNGLNSH
jgi:hypothetical protein